MNSICYKRNFIIEAIIRVDFATRINIFKDSLPKKLLNSLGKKYKFIESIDKYEASVQFKEGTFQNESIKYTEWTLLNTDRTRRVIICHDFIAFSVTNYTTFSEFQSDFSFIFKSLTKAIGDLSFKRCGLRFVNDINAVSGSPIDWEDIISHDLISVISISNTPSKISRSFHNLEHNYDDYNLRFRFGIFNPDYPSIVRKRSFILDFDAYKQGILDYNDILESLIIFHEKIQEYFELSITDQFRKSILNNE